MNSLFIVAGASRARLFRIAQITGSSVPEELIEIDSIQDENAGRRDHAAAPWDFAERIARQASEFARYHFCNPVVVAAPPGTSEWLLPALERKLPEACIRSVVRDMSTLEPPELLHGLQLSLRRPEPGVVPVP